MRTPRHSSRRPFSIGLAWALVGCAWMACLNPRPDELPTDRPSEGGTVAGVPANPSGAGGSAAGAGIDNAGSAGTGNTSAPAASDTPDAGAPPAAGLDGGGSDAGPADAGRQTPVDGDDGAGGGAE